MKRLFLLVSVFMFLAMSSTLFAQKDPIIGKWKTIDDETGEPKSIVEIYMRDGKFYGRVDSLFRKPGEDPNPKCDKCPEDDPRYNKPVLGMEIIKDMVKDGDEYVGGFWGRVILPTVLRRGWLTCKIHRLWLWDRGMKREQKHLQKNMGFAEPTEVINSWLPILKWTSFTLPRLMDGIMKT